jgi:hypothetical protein
VPASVDGTLPEQRILEQSMRLRSGGAVTGWASCRMHGGAFFDGLRRVVAGEAATESELRTLADEAGGWLRATEAQFLASEERLATMNADPASPLAGIAAEVRRAETLAREREEARRLLDGLEERTRELRTARLKCDAEVGSPFGPKS